MSIKKQVSGTLEERDLERRNIYLEMREVYFEIGDKLQQAIDILNEIKVSMTKRGWGYK